MKKHPNTSSRRLRTKKQQHSRRRRIYAIHTHINYLRFRGFATMGSKYFPDFAS
ncbi:hypothetical protein HanXRQr2_Chr17g0831731 [Helianthus annuus]|uniref:Uncharacterized protein n=1 Tax=Helianthus annuus TaxID=4232 RepID=A0A9K3GWP8_HELAN|nr:hypothetical protein HanXRQr2_Chr17g0831731 [Helianthus annuus]